MFSKLFGRKSPKKQQSTASFNSDMPRFDGSIAPQVIWVIDALEEAHQTSGLDGLLARAESLSIAEPGMVEIPDVGLGAPARQWTYSPGDFHGCMLMINAIGDKADIGMAFTTDYEGLSLRYKLAKRELELDTQGVEADQTKTLALFDELMQDPRATHFNADF